MVVMQHIHLLATAVKTILKRLLRNDNKTSHKKRRNPVILISEGADSPYNFFDRHFLGQWEPHHLVPKPRLTQKLLMIRAHEHGKTLSETRMQELATIAPNFHVLQTMLASQGEYVHHLADRRCKESLFAYAHQLQQPGPLRRLLNIAIQLPLNRKDGEAECPNERRKKQEHNEKQQQVQQERDHYLTEMFDVMGGVPRAMSIVQYNPSSNMQTIEQFANAFSDFDFQFSAHVSNNDTELAAWTLREATADFRQTCSDAQTAKNVQLPPNNMGPTAEIQNLFTHLQLSYTTDRLVSHMETIERYNTIRQLHIDHQRTSEEDPPMSQVMALAQFDPILADHVHDDSLQPAELVALNEKIKHSVLQFTPMDKRRRGTSLSTTTVLKRARVL